MLLKEMLSVEGFVISGGILISSIVQSSRGNTIFIKGSVNLKDNKYYENTRVYC